MRRAADRYGLLLLAPTAHSAWWNSHNGADMPENQHMLERALRETGRRVAVDGQKIALVGECNGGFPAHHWGFHNLDIFSRIGTISGELWDDSTIVVSHLIPRTTQTQFFVQESIVGGVDAVRIALVAAILGETLHDVWQDPQGTTDVLGQNIVFVKTHPQVIDALHRAGFFGWP